MNIYMKIAKELSDENLKTNAGGPFGACVVKNGEIIGCKSINSYDLSDCEIYTSCYPCPMCLSAIIWSNIKHVYYGNTKEDAAKIGFRDDFIYNYISQLSEGKANDNILNLNQMDREETIKTFDDFLNKKDKTMY